MRKRLAIVAALAVALASSIVGVEQPALAQTQQASVGAGVLSDYALYYLIIGRQATGTTDKGTSVTITFKADGTASTGYDSGTWKVQGGKVYLSWIPADKAWGLRADGAGRYYSTTSGREVTIR